MVIPIFISSQYKEAKDKEEQELKLSAILHESEGQSVLDDADATDAPRTLRVRSVSARRRMSVWMVFSVVVAVAIVGVLAFTIGSLIVRRYGGPHQTGWCKVEYSVEPFNRRAEQQYMHGYTPPRPREELPKTDEWIRLTEDSWELESQGAFDYKIVTDTNSEMSALKFKDFVDGNNYCFIGSRYDFGLPSYKNVQDFLEGLQDKAEIMVDHVSKVMYLSAGDLLPADAHLEPAIRRLCGPDTYKFNVAAINPDSDPDLKKVAQAEAAYYAASSVQNALDQGSLVQIIETLRRLQEVMAYLPNGDYYAQLPGGHVVSFEIVHPRTTYWVGHAAAPQIEHK